MGDTLTIESAIKHAEETADNLEREAECIRSWGKENDPKQGAINCEKCAKEHRQLAEWLKELKQLLEQGSILDKVREEIVDTLYVDSLIFGELIDFRNGKISADDVIEEFNRVTRLEVLQIIDKYKTESEGEE